MPTAALTSCLVTSPQAPSHDDSDDLVEACINQTAEAIILMGEVSQTEVDHAIDAVHVAQAQGRPIDLLEAIARLYGPQEQALATTIEAFGERLATTLNPSPRLIPFAGRLIIPHAFYESFDYLRNLAKGLLTPVIYAEDAGSIGVGSANPIAATLLAARIQDLVSRRFGIWPFLTIARLDYKSWTFLTHRHFKL
ncbi:MAG: hypothetical protein WCO57_08250 [Verrucomicrobiota bacterium]